MVSGVAQSLALLAQALRARGVTAIGVEDPGSRGAAGELAHWGLEPVPLPVDGEGLVVDDLVGSRLRAVLLTPAHQFPTGVVLSPGDAGRCGNGRVGGLLIEDDYDAEYRYDRAPVPALQASVPRPGRVHRQHLEVAGARTAARLAGPATGLLSAVVAAKHHSDLGSPALPQLALAQLIASGDQDRHIRLVRGRHRPAATPCSAGCVPGLPEARVQGVAAGLHLVVTWPAEQAGVPDTELAERVLAAGVRLQPLSWHRHRPGPPGFLLGYAAHPPDRLREAAGVVAGVLRAAFDRRPR